jgi:hypothetical protein
VITPVRYRYFTTKRPGGKALPFSSAFYHMIFVFFGF